MSARALLPRPAQLATLAACVAAGALGALPGAAGALDPVTLLGWLALLAPAAGALCGARAVAPLAALLVPAAWLLFLSAAQAGQRPDLRSPLLAGCALGGLFALGHALGSRSRLPLRSAGGLLLAGLLLSGAAPGFGLLAGGTELARAHPRLAARLLDVSPLVLVFDCAGHDWVHAQPVVYAAAGVEWVQRRAYPGNLAAPAVLVVGCGLSVLARRPRPAARGR